MKSFSRVNQENPMIQRVIKITWTKFQLPIFQNTIIKNVVKLLPMKSGVTSRDFPYMAQRVHQNRKRHKSRFQNSKSEYPPPFVKNGIQRIDCCTTSRNRLRPPAR